MNGDHNEVFCVLQTKGFWSADSAYRAGEIVYVGTSDSFWRCLTPNVNVWPSEGSKWTLLIGSRKKEPYYAD
jgi:hypothetical protein